MLVAALALIAAAVQVPPAAERIGTPRDAVISAHADLAGLDLEDQPYQRYVWVQDGAPLRQAVVSYAVNTAVSHASVTIKPKKIDGGRLLRFDLRKLCPKEEDLERVIDVWEELAVVRIKVGDKYFARPEPYFLVLKWVDVPPYKASDGKEYSRKESTEFGLHLDVNAAMSLAVLAHTKVPIVRDDYFVTRVLTQLDGGLYYQFLGVDRNPEGKTAQVAFLESFGASEVQVQGLRSDERAAIFRSGVTGKPRSIDIFYGVGVRPSVGVPLIAVTHDVQDADVDPARHPIYNLVQFDDRAREIIALRANGMMAGGLFNAAGALQDSVPDNIAKDHTIPAPHTARLEPMMSCLSCHLPKDGFLPFNNDVQLLLKDKLDVIDDFDDREAEHADVIDRVAGLYSGDLSEPLRLARNTHENACFRLTGLNVVAVGDGLRGMYHGYRYELVTPQTVCREVLGLVVSAEQAAEVFALKIPKLPPVPVLVDDEIQAVRLEDPTIAALRACEYDAETQSWNLGVSRIEYERVFPDLALRAQEQAKLEPHEQAAEPVVKAKE